MSDGVIRLRHRARLGELTLLEAALGAREASSGVADLAGRTLDVAGALLRRSRASGVPLADVERVLRLIPTAAVETWARTVDLDELESRLRRAAEEAVEAILPESPEDRETWAAWAREGIEARDRLESQLVALQHRESMGFAADRAVRERFAQALVKKDAALRPRCRWLVGLNPWRRDERDALDPEHRANAWWFTDRAECDDLIALLAGELEHSAHVHVCADCQRDLLRVESVSAPRIRHVTADELWNDDLGLCTPQERAVIERHARTCGECAQALAALSEGEEAIREITEPAKRRTRPGLGLSGLNPMQGDQRARVRNTEEPDVVADHADFRLLLFRRRERLRLLVQPRRAGRVAAAAVFLPDDPRRSLSARPGPDGFELDISESLRVRGAVRVRVQLQGSAQDVEQDVLF